MGIFSGIKDKVGGDRSDRKVYVLTPLGKSKSEDFDLPGSKWKVLAALNESGPSTAHDLASQSGMEEDKIKTILKSLVGEGFVRRAAATE